MRINRQNLDIVFRKIHPEAIRSSIIEKETVFPIKKRNICSANIPEDIFLGLSNGYTAAYSRNERALQHGILLTEMSNGPFRSPSIFNLLYSFAEDMLTTNRYMPICKYDAILKWQDTTHKLGQDLFTTVYLAVKDAEIGTENEVFSWEAVLKNDNVRLQEILSNGIAENHYHLNGSTQSFPINWVLAMNHPETIFLADKWGLNMSAATSFSTEDNVLPWSVKLFWAVEIRRYLFSKIYFNFDEDVQKQKSEDLREYLNVQDVLDVHTHIPDLIAQLQTLQFLFGAVAKYDQSPLDYALIRTMNIKNMNHNRILAGERSLMYHCFQSILNGSFNQFDSDVFYLYLSIKSNFRSELIQTNGEVGFQNFADYQDRKGLFYDDETIKKRYPDYSDEALRFALQGVLSEQHLKSLEARIMPKSIHGELARIIKGYDNLIDNYIDSMHSKQPEIPDHKSWIKERGDRPYFFVIHYPKSKYTPDEDHSIHQARNQKVRDRNAHFTRALFLSLSIDPYMRDAILGIDACANEIGCRPETFAPDFRFLRTVIPQNKNSILSFHENPSQLNVTYHVGEDFLNITDGLRAIDECISFLGMRQGDRFGHALALGVDADDYYNSKGRRLIMPKQDILDDDTWLLFRANELGIDIDPKLEMQLKNRINEKMHYIYGSFATGNSDNPSDPFLQKRLPLDLTPLNYYLSWKLRGDAPDLYKNGYYQENQDVWIEKYKSEWTNKGLKKEAYIRSDQTITGLYYAYHYDIDSKKRGAEIDELKVDSEYISLVKKVQKKMQKYVANKGIMIECNPSSNYLIGTIGRYDKHPIITFNNLELEINEDAKKNCPQLSVSINTDDQGVFDTLLCNEYAIMAAALERKTDANGHRVYTASQVYRYLDSVRRMGLEQSFKLKCT